MFKYTPDTEVRGYLEVIVQNVVITHMHISYREDFIAIDSYDERLTFEQADAILNEAIEQGAV